jgi:hypothetical protein
MILIDFFRFSSILLFSSIEERGIVVLFEKNQKVMSFLLAPKKELKKTSTPLHLSPIWESSNSDLQKPQILLCFGIAGRRDIFFICCANHEKPTINAVADKKVWRTPTGRKLESQP